MNKIYRTLATLVVASPLLLTSCNKFLDVQPKGTVTEETLFTTQEGFQDAMYGVYSSLAQATLYGGDLSYHFVDKLGQMFGYQNGIDSRDPYILAYNYTHDDVAQRIDAMWTEQYRVINTLNNILRHAQSGKVSGSAMQLVEGEIYGLRAFLHFDMLRLFAPSYRLQPDAVGLPYADTYNLQNKNVYTVQDTYEKILADLDRAETLLANNTELTYSSRVTAYDKSRITQFNIYAVYATKARVYRSMGDYTNAALYARKLTEESTSVLGLSAHTAFASVKRFPVGASPKTGNELIFGLFNDKIGESIYKLFFGNSSSPAKGVITEARSGLTSLYGLNNASGDVRFDAYYRYPSARGDNELAVFQRFASSTTDATAFKGFTLIRLPEMYYILAEALYDSDKAGALDALNKVRHSRGLVDLKPEASQLANREVFEAELMREYMREFPGEGQIFFSLKHFNRAFTAFDNRTQISPSNEVFVLPRPQNELEYGNKQN